MKNYLPEIREALNRFGGVARYADLGVIIHIVTDVEFDEQKMKKLVADIHVRAEKAIEDAVNGMVEMKEACVVVELAESSGILRNENLRWN